MILKKHIIPAIISTSQKELNNNIEKVADFVDIIQIDIMDGNFVQNKSNDFDFTLPKTNCKFEAHLMINNPQFWIEKNYIKVDTILVHFESIKNPMEIIQQVKNKSKNIGFVLNPETDVKQIFKYLDIIDQILIMTVNPGFYGNSFLPEMLDKVKKIRSLNPDLNIEVDGGITDETISSVNKAGANLFVSGSYIIKSNNVNEAINRLKNLIF